MCIKSSRMSIIRVIWLNISTRWPAAFNLVRSLSRRIIYNRHCPRRTHRTNRISNITMLYVICYMLHGNYQSLSAHSRRADRSGATHTINSQRIALKSLYDRRSPCHSSAQGALPSGRDSCPPCWGRGKDGCSTYGAA